MNTRREFLINPIKMINEVLARKLTNAVSSENDISESQLKMKIMGLGHDPSNMSRAHMLEILDRAEAEQKNE